MGQNSWGAQHLAQLRTAGAHCTWLRSEQLGHTAPGSTQDNWDTVHLDRVRTTEAQTLSADVLRWEEEKLCSHGFLDWDYHSYKKTPVSQSPKR